MSAQESGPEEDSKPSVAQPSIPVVVHASAAAISFIALALALLLGVVAAFVGGGLGAAGAGPMFGAMLLGQGVEVEARVLFGPRLSAATAFVPLGAIVPLAFRLTRIGFAREWLRVRRGRILPAFAGGFVAVVVGFLLSTIGDVSVGLSLASFGAQVTSRPLWAFAVGAAPWLLAALIINSPPAARILRGLFVLQIVSVVLAVGYLLLLLLELDLSAGLFIGAFLGLTVAGFMFSTNLLLILLVLPLGGAVGIRYGGETLSVGMVTLLRQAPSQPVLWGLVVFAVAAVVLLGWRDGAAPDLRTALVRTRTTLIAATATVLPMLLLGSIYGDAASELGFLSRFFGGFSGGSFSTSFGSTGQPARWVIVAVVSGLILFVTHVVAARRAGLSWASDQSLSSSGQDIVKTTSGRLRNAAEQARQAAEAARRASENLADDSSSTPPTAPPQDVPPADGGGTGPTTTDPGGPEPPR